MGMTIFFTTSATRESNNTNVWRRLLNADHAYNIC